MILRMYSIRDRLTGFMTPVLEQSDPAAMRNFRMACDVRKRDTSLMSYSPSDFEFYHIADFDSSSGVLSPVSPIEVVCRGSDFVD